LSRSGRPLASLAFAPAGERSAAAGTAGPRYPGGKASARFARFRFFGGRPENDVVRRFLAEVRGIAVSTGQLGRARGRWSGVL